MKRIEMVIMLLAFALAGFAQDRGAVAGGGYDALGVVEKVAKFMTQADFGKVAHVERNDSNTYASCTINFETDKKVCWMLCDGFAWQFMNTERIGSRQDSGKLIDTYIHTPAGGKTYYIVITRLATGHDSAIVYVDIETRLKHYA